MSDYSNPIYSMTLKDANLMLMDEANKKFKKFTPISAENLPEFHEKLEGIYKNSYELEMFCYKMAKLWITRQKIETIQKEIRNQLTSKNTTH